MLRKLIALTLTLTLLAGAALATEVAEAPVRVFVDARIVTKVLDEGQVVAGVRIEWDAPFTAGELTTASFVVNGYTIVALYVNEDGAWHHAETAGRYVFLEFEDPAGIGTGTHNTLQYKDGGNVLRDLTIDVQCLYDMNLYAVKGYIHTEIDDYLALSETAGDYTTDYRLFVPKGWEGEKLPLVIWLHGAGERGSDNYAQLAANRGALNFSDAEAQASHPSFVLAPQAHETGWDEPALANINNVVLGLIENYNVDASRIYVAGCSMGGRGSKALVLAYPDMIAGALVTANASFSDDEAELKAFAEVPMWLMTASDDSGGEAGATLAANVEVIEGLGIGIISYLGDDGLNGFLRGQEAVEDVRRVTSAAEGTGANMIASTYIVGTVLPAAHWSWMAATDNEAVRDWLFAQLNEAPYTGQ
jgi:predicted peptidase